MSTETSRLVNWKQTDYHWREECTRCDIGMINTGLLVTQSILNLGAFVIDVAVMSLPDCNNRFMMTMGFAAGAFAVNCIFLSFTCFLKQRYSCCRGQPAFTDKILIVREKCCYDTTIGLSLIYMTLNVGCVVANCFLCK